MPSSVSATEVTLCYRSVPATLFIDVCLSILGCTFSSGWNSGVYEDANYIARFCLLEGLDVRGARPVRHASGGRTTAEFLVPRPSVAPAAPRALRNGVQSVPPHVAPAILKQVPVPTITPRPLTRHPEPFAHPDWLFEIKWDGFRALAYVERDTASLVSRNGNTFKNFPD